MDRDVLFQEYQLRKKQLDELTQVGQYQLALAIKRRGITIHSLVARVKEFDSFADKAAKKGLREPFSEVHDLVGVRVVCLFLTDLQAIDDVIKGVFTVVEEDNKIETVASDVFGYMGVHYIVVGQGTLPDHLRMPFEIQVRTIAQEAWDSVSHHLDYKRTPGIPPKMKKDFYALNGLFYVADQHFEMLKQRVSDAGTDRQNQADFGKNA